MTQKTNRPDQRGNADQAMSKVRPLGKDHVMNSQTDTTRKDPPATVEQLAAMSFEPWAGPAGDPPISKEGWNTKQAVMWMVMSYSHRIMHMTKAEIMADMEAWSEEKGDMIMLAFVDISDLIKGAGALIDAAETRILCAGAALELAEGNAS